MIKHALLSASSAHRWLACPPSARICAQFPDESSEYAKQGTDAHALCQYLVEKELGIDSEDPTASLEYYDSEMQSCAESYRDFVTETLIATKEFCSDPVVLIEQRLDFSNYVEEGFGTGDCVIVADETLSIIDYKHGLGIMVSAEMNPQMLCYALGALELFDGIYDINSVTMTIFQPRRDNISTYTISKEELLKWADEVLSPTAQLAAKGEGEYKAGDHCQFCKVKATCRKRAEYNLELAHYDFEMPSTLEDDEIEAILSKVDALVSWAGDIKEYALQQALEGKEWKDWKIVEGRSNRKYVNETAVADTVKDAGYDPYEHKVLGVTAMTKLLGRTKFEELLSGFIEKPQGKSTLVPMSDKRPAMNNNKAAEAADDFKEEN